MTRQKQRLLIICPSFFGYDQAIAEAAKRQGFAVTLLDARAMTGVAYKIALKMLPRLTRKATEARFSQRIAAIDGIAATDHILFIRGDGMTTAVTRQLRALTPRARMTAYLWDSLKNMPGMAPSFALADRVLTFDRNDSNAFNWVYLPLFARASTLGNSIVSDGAENWDWSFIGSLHSDRHRVLRDLIAAHPSLRSFVHCYVQNAIVKLARSFADPGILSARPPALNFNIMPYPRYQEVVRQSRAIVDIEHPSQTGMTMRTIETLLDGKKLITTNAAVRDSDLYHPSRVAIIDRHQPRIDAAFLDAPFLPIPEETRRSYQIESWLKKVLG